MANPEYKDINIMSCTEVAKFLRVKVGTVYSWISYQQIPKNLYRKTGRKPLFIKEELIAWFLAGAELKPRRKMKVNNA